MTMTSPLLNRDVDSKRICSICDKTFLSVTSAKNHTREIHNFKLLFCKVCEKVCTSKLSLRNHMKKHQKHKCSQCDAMLTGNNYLKHEAKHKGNSERKKTTELKYRIKNMFDKFRNKVPCICKFCGKSFEWTKSCTKHEKMCRNNKRVEQEFKCGCCDKSYKWRKSLTRHVSESHDLFG